MAERKFTDDEIIKALEWCIQNSECEYCEYRERTDKSDICPIRMDALNLINKQNAEIERLKYNLKAVLDEIPETKREVVREIFAEVNMQIIPYSTDIYIKGEELIIIPKSDYNAILTELEKKHTEETK